MSGEHDEIRAPARAQVAAQARKPRPRRLLVVTGAKGGVGKTLLATNLALYLATIGRRVVLVDADPGGANVHTCLGIPRPAAKSTGLSDTTLPGLSLLTVGLDEPRPHRAQSIRRGFAAELRGLDAEYVVVDAGAGLDAPRLDLAMAANVSLFVTLPEPTAMENTYRFARAAFAHHLARTVGDATDRSRLRRALQARGVPPAPIDFVSDLDADEDPLAAAAMRVLGSFSVRLVVNQTRVRADLELGDAVRVAARRRLGITVDYVGYIDYDDAAWSCVRGRRPLLVESPGTKASKSIERLARRLLAQEAGKSRGMPIRTVPPDTHHDLLEVDRGATDEEIRRAYKKAREIYSRDALCCYGLFVPEELDSIRARIEEARDVLLDSMRRRPYELSVFPPEPQPGSIPPQAMDHTEPPPPAPPVTPETEFTGPLLRAVRESQGVDLRQVSKQTKIGTLYLRAIEEDDFGALPALVYVRGFVAELGKCLKLDPVQVSRTYVKRYKRFLDERSSSGGAVR